MQVPLRVIDAIALAQRIEVVALARVLFPGEDKGVKHSTNAIHRLIRRRESQFTVQKSDVKRGVMNNQLGPCHKFKKFILNFSKTRLIG